MQNRNNFGILLVSGVFALSAVAVAFITTNFEKRGPPIENVSIEIVENSSSSSSRARSEEDTDNDGLANWKEALFSTDPNNPDTDGDGTNDGDEVSMGSSPTVFGTEPTSEIEYVAPKTLSPTNAIARELFTSYAKSQSGLLDSNDFTSVVEDIVERRLPVKDDDVQVYMFQDIAVGNDVPIVEYIGSVDRALRDAQQIREYELSVFARVVEKNSDNDLEKLKATAAVYRNIEDQLLELQVPGVVVTEHLAFLNSMEALIYEIEQMSTWGGDPFEALVLVGAYGDAEDAMITIMNNLYVLVSILQKQT